MELYLLVIMLSFDHEIVGQEIQIPNFNEEKYAPSAALFLAGGKTVQHGTCVFTKIIGPNKLRPLNRCWIIFHFSAE